MSGSSLSRTRHTSLPFAAVPKQTAERLKVFATWFELLDQVAFCSLTSTLSGRPYQDLDVHQGWPVPSHNLTLRAERHHVF